MTVFNLLSGINEIKFGVKVVDEFSIESIIMNENSFKIEFHWKFHYNFPIGFL